MFFSWKALKARKRSWHLLCLIMSVKEYGWTIQKMLFAQTNKGSTFSQTRENWKSFNITSKYFSFFNNKPPTSWVAHITRDFLTYYSCLYYSFMIYFKCKMQILNKNFSTFATVIMIRSLIHFLLCYWNMQSSPYVFLFVNDSYISLVVT